MLVKLVELNELIEIIRYDSPCKNDMMNLAINPQLHFKWHHKITYICVQ